MGSERFIRAVDYVIANEIIDEDHVESNDPKDKGGFTRYGITEKTAKRHGMSVRTLTKEQARVIYFLEYWDHAYDLIKDEVLATKVFDFAVNAGPGAARRYLQRAANDLGSTLKVDGVLGPLSVAAVNALDPTTLVLRFAWLTYDDHYTPLARRDPSQARFLNGWRNRMSQVPIVKEETLS